MTDHQPGGTGGGTGGGIPKPVHDLVAQLHGLTEKLAGLTGLTGLVESLPGVGAVPSLPRPASLSAAQLKAVTSTVAAQRRSIEAMQAQLRAFDEQLTVMEKILEPLTEWVTVWADLEGSVMGRTAPPDE
jgi:LmbE family N-acetylglucosaminyl deacetylase